MSSQRDNIPRFRTTIPAWVSLGNGTFSWHIVSSSSTSWTDTVSLQRIYYIGFQAVYFGLLARGTVSQAKSRPLELSRISSVTKSTLYNRKLEARTRTHTHIAQRSPSTIWEGFIQPCLICLQLAAEWLAQAQNRSSREVFNQRAPLMILDRPRHTSPHGHLLHGGERRGTQPSVEATGAAATAQEVGCHAHLRGATASVCVCVCLCACA